MSYLLIHFVLFFKHFKQKKIFFFNFRFVGEHTANLIKVIVDIAGLDLEKNLFKDLLYNLLKINFDR